jgi:hypothetical protein
MEEADMLLWPHVPNCTIFPSQKRYSKRDERLDNTDLRGARTTFPQERDVFDRRAVPCSLPSVLISRLAGGWHTSREEIRSMRRGEDQVGTTPSQSQRPTPPAPYESDLCATIAPIPRGVPSSITSSGTRPACSTQARRSDKGWTFPCRVHRAKSKP